MTRERLRPVEEMRVREASLGGWTPDGKAQPNVGDLRAVLDELDWLRKRVNDLTDKLLDL